VHPARAHEKDYAHGVECEKDQGACGHGQGVFLAVVTATPTTTPTSDKLRPGLPRQPRQPRQPRPVTTPTTTATTTMRPNDRRASTGIDRHLGHLNRLDITVLDIDVDLTNDGRYCTVAIGERMGWRLRTGSIPVHLLWFKSMCVLFISLLLFCVADFLLCVLFASQCSES
jgi:hypothetical protein